jgi:hypothetical protein
MEGRQRMMEQHATDPRSNPLRPHSASGTSRQCRGSDPISRPARVWADIDGNSREGQFIRQLRAELVQHVGRPSATQRILIERAVMLATHLARMDADALKAGSMSDHARRQYLAWDSSLRRAMCAIGMKGASSPLPTLAEYLAAKAATTASAPSAPMVILPPAPAQTAAQTADAGDCAVIPDADSNGA